MTSTKDTGLPPGEEPHFQDADEVITHKPMMSTGNIFMMNVGFFWSSVRIRPHSDRGEPPLLRPRCRRAPAPAPQLGGPDHRPPDPAADRCNHRPHLASEMGPSSASHPSGCPVDDLDVLAFPFISVLWLAVVALWLLDAGDNTAMEPYRALISDRLPKNQLARGFLVQSMFTDGGAVLSNLSIFISQKFVPGVAANGIPYWAYICS